MRQILINNFFFELNKKYRLECAALSDNSCSLNWKQWWDTQHTVFLKFTPSVILALISEGSLIRPRDEFPAFVPFSVHASQHFQFHLSCVIHTFISHKSHWVTQQFFFLHCGATDCLTTRWGQEHSAFDYAERFKGLWYVILRELRWKGGWHLLPNRTCMASWLRAVTVFTVTG